MIVENFFGLQGQEQEKRTKKDKIKPRLAGLGIYDLVVLYQ